MGECERLGIAAYLLKPIKQSELLEAIEVALGILGTRRAQPSQADQRRFRGRSLRILLAEDSLVNQQLAVALLQGEGHTVSVVSNGREAVAAVDHGYTVPAGDFDLALMDVQMPEMDGLEATAIIRANERNSGRHLPIIAMTAHALKGDRERCLAAGMDAYTSKPIDAEELFAAIESQVFGPAVAAGGRLAPTERALAPLAADAAAGGCPAPIESVVDWSAALKTVRGDARLLDTIVATALGEIPNLLGGNPPRRRRRRFHGPPPGGTHPQGIGPLFRGPVRAGSGPAAGGHGPRRSSRKRRRGAVGARSVRGAIDGCSGESAC